MCMYTHVLHIYGRWSGKMGEKWNGGVCHVPRKFFPSDILRTGAVGSPVLDLDEVEKMVLK